MDFRFGAEFGGSVYAAKLGGALLARAEAIERDRVARARRQAAEDLAVAQVRVLNVDVASLTSEEALEALAAVQVQAARLQALENDLLVRAAGASRVVREVLVDDVDPDDGLPTGRRPRRVELVDEVIDEIACCLRRSVGSIRYQVGVARMLNGPLAATRTELAAGRITAAHASALADQAYRLVRAPLGADPQADAALAKLCEQLEQRVLPKAQAETAGQTRSRARRAVAVIDAAGAGARQQRARTTCDVTGTPLDDGLAVIEAVLPALDAARVLALVEQGARDAIRAGDADALGLDADSTLGQVRAAVLTRMLLGGSEAASESSTKLEIGVLIDAATLTGLTPQGPVWVRTGAGAHAEASRSDLLDLLAEPGTHAVLRRLVTDPATGALVDSGANTYRVSASLRAWLNARDGTCSFPTCTRPAFRCDADHIVDFRDGGATTRRNTHLLCRRHHNAKTHSGWRVDDFSEDGACTFVSPSGKRYRHEPVELAPVVRPPAAAVPSSREPLDADPPPF